MNGRAYKIVGMDCAEEIAALRREVGPLTGDANLLTFDLMNAKMTVTPGVLPVDETQILQAVSRAGLKAIPWNQFVDSRARGAETRWWDRNGRIAMCSASGILCGTGLVRHAMDTGFVAAFAGEGGVPVASTAIACFAASAVLGGWFVYPKAWTALRHLRADMNLLMTIAVIGAMLLGQWFEAATVAFLFALALVLESWSVGRARNAIRALLSLAPQTARYRCPHDGDIEEKPVDSVPVGVEVLVRPGERVPLDGVVSKGDTTINQAPITGESTPVAKGPGETVYAGTINNEGAIEFRVTRAASDTTLARIIHMVEAAQTRRAASEQWVEKFARIYTPAMILFALGIALLPPLADGAWRQWFYEALVVLVIACPCALVISTPVSIVAGLATAARAGVLVKGGVFLEQAALLRAVALDKTGTLTRGRLDVQRIAPVNGFTDLQVLAHAAAIEAHSAHPVALSIVRRAQVDNIEVPPAVDFQSMPGRGARASIDGEQYWTGSHRMLHETNAGDCEFHDIAETMEDDGHSVVAVGTGNRLLGFISLADGVRSNARESVARLKSVGVRQIVMLTGDNEGTAKAVSTATGVDACRAELLPQDKVDAIEELVRKHTFVGMIGDGVNDAPAMAVATLGIAMAAAGSDAAIETADIALMSDDLARVPWLIEHARKTRAIILQNIVFALGVKAAFLALALAGLATLWMAIAADMGASLLVIFNALRLLRNTP